MRTGGGQKQDRSGGAAREQCVRLRIRAGGPTGSTLTLPRTSHRVASPPLPPRSDCPSSISGGDSPNPRFSGLFWTTASFPVIHGLLPLPVQTRRGGAASVAGGPGRAAAHSVLMRRNITRSPLKTQAPPKHLPGLRRRACAQRTNDEPPYACG